MVVYLEPTSGTARDNLERAMVEMERVVGFRGKVTGAKIERTRIALAIESTLNGIYRMSKGYHSLRNGSRSKSASSSRSLAYLKKRLNRQYVSQHIGTTTQQKEYMG